MKFYQVYDDADPAGSDSWYAFKRGARLRLRSIKNNGGSGTMHVHEHRGRLNRVAVCKLLTNWPRR